MSKSKELKRQEAEERQQKRSKRGPQDQIASLDAKFGKNVGAKKEREKLLAIINKKEEAKDKEETKEKAPKKRKNKKDEQLD